MKLYSHLKIVATALVSPIFSSILCATHFCQAQFYKTPQADDGGYLQVSVNDDVQSRMVLLEIHGTPSDLSHQDLILMADIFKDVYHQEQDLYCDEGEVGQNRHLNLISAEIRPNKVIGFGSDPRIVPARIDFSFFVQLDFYCVGCQATGFDVFEEIIWIFNRQNAYEVPFPSSEMSLKPCVPNYQEFIAKYSNAVMGMDIPGLDMVYGATELHVGADDNKCDGGSTFESELTIAFYGNTDFTDILGLDAQLAVVEQLFIATYNDLNVLNPLTCDPYSRILSNATATLYETNTTQGDQARRRLRRRIGYDWKFLNIYFGGICYGCPTDACLTDDVSMYATCGGSRRQRHRHLSEGSESSLDSCYCTEDAASNNTILPTNEEFLLALEDQFEILRNATNFTLVESIVYLIEVEVPDACCGWPVNGNLPVDVDGSDFQSAISSYLSTGTSIYGTPINCWDVSSVTDMTSAFVDQENFNEPLICWDTSKVTSMGNMFYQASNFNSDISSWNTSRVTAMFFMFYGALRFNSDISSWDTSKVTSMIYMFYQALNFASDISSWDTGRVTRMDFMFYQASSFTSNIATWNTSSVTRMAEMFYQASNFNSDISGWDTSRVTGMEYMFYQAPSFNSNISSWNTSRVTRMAEMFSGASNFNIDISTWDTSGVVTMNSMFSSASSFNIDISAWNTSRVTTMQWMFSGASSFNIDISAWNTSRVTTMSQMFSSALSFNNDISTWDTSRVTTMSNMFYQASSFNNDISTWDTSRVIFMQNMFYQASSFNINISAWNTSSVTTMRSMFQDATSFNSDISTWDTSKVKAMDNMFNSASQFQQNLCPWRFNDDNLVSSFSIFSSTNCPNTANPLPDVGPWCFAC